MIYKVGILGATGQVGRCLTELLFEPYVMDKDVLELTVVLAKDKSITSVEGIPVQTLQDLSIDLVHGYIDFSTPHATLNLLEKTKAPVVVGTTGFSDSQLDTIRSYAKSRPILMSGNFSEGMAWLTRVLNELGIPSFTTEIFLKEEHHRLKKDAPSGTAKMLEQALKSSKVPLSLASFRGGSIFGNHELVFVGDNEVIRIEHVASSRKIFALGALKALHFLLKINQPGLYTFQDVYKSVRSPS